MLDSSDSDSSDEIKDKTENNSNSDENKDTKKNENGTDSNLDQTLILESESGSSYSNSTLNDSAKKLQKVLDSSTAIRMGVFDGNRQEKTDFFNSWELVEPEGTRGAVEAYEVVVNNYDKRLSLELLGNIREKFTTKGTNYEKFTTKEYTVKDIYNDSQHFKINIEDIVKKNIGNDKNQSIKSIKSIEGELKKHQSELKERLKLNNDSSAYNLSIKGDTIKIEVNLENDKLKECIKSLLDQYEASIANNSFAQEKLITLVMDLERMHPYPDFNCRTFCVMLLNKELIKHNKSPCVMEDPNDFDWDTSENLVRKVEQGQDNFKYLVKHGILHENDPKDIDIFLKIESIDNLINVVSKDSTINYNVVSEACLLLINDEKKMKDVFDKLKEDPILLQFEPFFEGKEDNIKALYNELEKKLTTLKKNIDKDKIRKKVEIYKKQGSIEGSITLKTSSNNLTTATNNTKSTIPSKGIITKKKKRSRGRSI